MRESGSDKGAGNWGNHPSSVVLLALVGALRTGVSPSPPPSRYSCFSFSLSPSSSALPSTHPFQLDSPLPPRSHSVSLTLSALRLFTLLIPQHPPRNNDVGPCFSCFPLLFLSFFPFRYLSLSAYLFLPLFHSLSRYFCLLSPLKRSNTPRRDGEEDAAYLRPNPCPEPDFPSKNEEFVYAHIFPYGVWKMSRKAL